MTSLVQIYECLCDRTRLRILHLLGQGPLCVCHFQEVLGEAQVKVSKHLAYLRARALVDGVTVLRGRARFTAATVSYSASPP